MTFSIYKDGKYLGLVKAHYHRVNEICGISSNVFFVNGKCVCILNDVEVRKE